MCNYVSFKGIIITTRTRAFGEITICSYNKQRFYISHVKENSLISEVRSYCVLKTYGEINVLKRISKLLKSITP